MTVFQDNIRLSSDIFTFLRDLSSGEVLLTTSKGVYLQFSSGIILLTDQEYGITPIGLGLSRFVDFVTAISPKAGQSVWIRDGQIQFPGGVLIADWQVIEPQTSRGELHYARIDHCAALLLNQCSDRSTARLAAPLLLGQAMPSADPLCVRSLPVLQALLSGLRDYDSDRIHSSVSKLLGLGHGLTPSMDDVLLGMLYGLLRFAPQEAHTAALKDAIMMYATTLTNSISAAYLIAVAQGGYFQRLDSALESLYSNDAIDIAPILEIGSSSGSEMFFGLLLAANITTRG